MRRAIVILIIISMFSIGAASASDIEDRREELNEINERIDKTKDELEEIKGRQRKTAGEIEDLNEQQAETKDDIEHLNDQLLITRNELKKIDAQLIDKTKELELVEKQLDDTQNELKKVSDELARTIAQASEHETMMAKRVRVMYMNRTTSYLELLIESENINELLDRLEIIRNVVSFDQKVLEELKLYREKVDAQKVRLEEKEQQITALAETVSEQKHKIEQAKNERSKLLAKLTNQQLKHEDLLKKLELQERRRNTTLVNLEKEEEKYERELDDLERTSKQLEREIQELIRKQNERSRRAEFSGGVMRWPVPGFYRVTSPFGYRVHPVFGTRRMHAGIDIGSNITNRGRQSIYGRNFVAAADGVVILAGRFGGYGNTVIIDHGGDITTLYAHGSRILVLVGQKVDRGDPVMTVGSTGVSTGAHAHFEVRVNGTPVDPMPYLRGR
jgi:murein DD-endopeptidase MepM/ murein hydrolase activator NlpD